MKFKFIVIRWADDFVLIFPIKEKASEKEISEIIARCYSEFMDAHEGYDFFDKNRKLISTYSVAKTVVRYAIEKELQFWCVENRISNHLPLGDGAIKDYCQDQIRHDFDDVLKIVRVELDWYRFTQD